MESNALQTIHTRYGAFTIDTVSDKKMAAALRGIDYPNEKLLWIARQFVSKTDTVLDIGAHIGTFAIPVASFAGKVIAVEPSKEAATLLTRNARENNVTLTLIEKALGSEAGSGSLVVRNASNAGANTLVAGGDIPVVTLDSEVMEAGFIKMDVEGMELEVLKGGTKLIERSRPPVLFEVNLFQLRAHHTSLRALQRFFTSRGYQLYYPLEEEKEMLARVHSMTLLTALIAPRAWLLFGESAPFDLVAVPKERVPSQSASFARALWVAVRHNVAIKLHRMRFGTR